ncbi:MAG: hypothetical protein R3F46_05560 [bacterium]
MDQETKSCLFGYPYTWLRCLGILLAFIICGLATRYGWWPKEDSSYSSHYLAMYERELRDWQGCFEIDMEKTHVELDAFPRQNIVIRDLDHPAGSQMHGWGYMVDDGRAEYEWIVSNLEKDGYIPLYREEMIAIPEIETGLARIQAYNSSRSCLVVVMIRCREPSEIYNLYTLQNTQLNLTGSDLQDRLFPEYSELCPAEE